jgi:hypothetical protein
MLAQVLGSPMKNFYIYINIKVRKILHKVNLYNVSQRFHNISYAHKDHHYITITTMCNVNINNRFKITKTIDISSQFTYYYYSFMFHYIHNRPRPTDTVTCQFACRKLRCSIDRIALESL